MRILFIRHGDPDYEHDCLTEKGKREAALLAKRVARWNNITDYYVSPLGRAQETCHFSLDPLGKQAETLQWLKEFSVDVKEPGGGSRNIPWDYLPSYWKEQKIIYDKDHWSDLDLYDGSQLRKNLKEVEQGLDSLLGRYGITKVGDQYHIDHEKDDTTIVCFCHLGVSYLCMGYLLGISPFVLWHTFFTAPTSVSIVAAEEREPGIISFRVEKMGDTTHLHDGGEPISPSGYFYKDVFQD